MPPTPVAQLAQNERMGQAPPPTQMVIPPPTTVPPQSLGVTVGIAANPIYPDVATTTAPAKQVNTLATQVLLLLLVIQVLLFV